MQNLYLIGFMGTGKSTIARCFQKEYKMRLVEMDEEIATQEGMTVSDIFALKGELYFRDVETQFLKGIACDKNQIISCGGGLVLREENVTIMKESGTIVLLEASPETVFERVKENDDRPLLRSNKNVAYISELMEKRRPKYEAAADIRVYTDEKSALEICMEIIDKLK